MSAASPPDRDDSDARDWGLIVLIGACALLVGVLDVLWIPLYVGSVLIPVAVVVALVANFVLPRWAYATVRSGMAAAVPFVAWLAPVLVLPLFPRPEGDVVVLGGGDQQLTFYGVVLLGCAMGFWTIVRITAPARPNPPLPTTRASRPGQGNPGKRVNR